MGLSSSAPGNLAWFTRFSLLFYLCADFACDLVCPLGLLPIFDWLVTLERKPPVTRKLHTIERLQAWSMLGYYPLEHIYWLLSHSIIPSTMTFPSLFPELRLLEKPAGKQIILNGGQLSRISIRFWLAYIVLQFMHFTEDSKRLVSLERVLSKSKVI